MVKGQILWRYWIRIPANEDDINSTRGEDGEVPVTDITRAAQLINGAIGKVHETWTSCRIKISLEGFEWFLYNRTAAYDNILAQMEPLKRAPSRVSETQRQRPKSRPGTPCFSFPIVQRKIEM